MGMNLSRFFKNSAFENTVLKIMKVFDLKTSDNRERRSSSQKYHKII